MRSSSTPLCVTCQASGQARDTYLDVVANSCIKVNTPTQIFLKGRPIVNACRLAGALVRTCLDHKLWMAFDPACSLLCLTCDLETPPSRFSAQMSMEQTTAFAPSWPLITQLLTRVLSSTSGQNNSVLRVCPAVRRSLCRLVGCLITTAVCARACVQACLQGQGQEMPSLCVRQPLSSEH